MSKHYIRIDERNCITAGWSDGPHPEVDTSSAILLREDGGYQFRLFEGGEESPPLMTAEGVPLYVWTGKDVVSRMQEDVDADIAALPLPPPSETELLRDGLLEAYEAVALVYEDVLSQQEQGLLAMEAIAELYEMMI